LTRAEADVTDHDLLVAHRVGVHADVAVRLRLHDRRVGLDADRRIRDDREVQEMRRSLLGRQHEQCTPAADRPGVELGGAADAQLPEPVGGHVHARQVGV
jgi:hypothetical protein